MAQEIKFHPQFLTDHFLRVQGNKVWWQLQPNLKSSRGEGASLEVQVRVVPFPRQATHKGLQEEVTGGAQLHVSALKVQRDAREEVVEVRVRSAGSREKTKAHKSSPPGL